MINITASSSTGGQVGMCIVCLVKSTCVQDYMPLVQIEPEMCQFKVCYLGLAAVTASIPTFVLYTCVLECF